MKAFASIALASIVALAGCGGDDDGGGGAAAVESNPPGLPGGPTIEDPGPIHVHGLGVNPADGALFIATHTGLFRAPEGELTAERVGDRYQDTMGFTVVGPDRFLGSGHPDGREKLPPFLGLIRSDDSGQSWQPVSLLGKADFHVLEAAGDTVYGYGSDFETRRQRLLTSTDGGESWQKRPLPEPPSDELAEESLLALAIDPEDPDSVIASGREALWASTDQGRKWRILAAEPGLLAWPEPERLFLIEAEGHVKASNDSGRSWTDVGELGGEPAAFEAADGSLYAALHDGTVKQSADGGESWQVRSRP